MNERSIGEARKSVRTYSRSKDLGKCMLSTGNLSDMSTDELKELEYGMLVGPISRGLRNYLDDNELASINEQFNASQLLEAVGLRLAREIIAQFKVDPNFPAMSMAANERAGRHDENLAANIAPLAQTIITASISSANALYDSACAAMATLQEDGAASKRGHTDLIEIVKRSTQLPLSRAASALSWQQSTDEAIFQYVTLKGPNRELLLRFNAEEELVRMTKPIPAWHDHFNYSSSETSRIGDIKPADERIGCPISFEPGLLAEYYRHMIDLIEKHHAWPGPR